MTWLGRAWQLTDPSTLDVAVGSWACVTAVGCKGVDGDLQPSGVKLELFSSKQEAFTRSAQVLHEAGNHETPQRQRLRAQLGTLQPTKTLYQVAAAKLGGKVGGTSRAAQKCWDLLEDSDPILLQGPGAQQAGHWSRQVEGSPVLGALTGKVVSMGGASLEIGLLAEEGGDSYWVKGPSPAAPFRMPAGLLAGGASSQASSGDAAVFASRRGRTPPSRRFLLRG